MTPLRVTKNDIRKILTTVAISALLACCSSEEPVNPLPTPEPAEEELPIEFDGDISDVRSVTRAALNDNGGPASFRVWAFKNDSYDAGAQAYTGYQTVMDGYKVTFSSGHGTTGWEYIGLTEAQREQTVKFWDYSAKAYRFLAYAPADATGAAVTVGGTPATASMAIEADGNDPDATPYVSELWYSTGNASLYPDKLFGHTVQLKFYKPLARVRMMFTFSSSVTHYGREALTDITFAPLDGSKIAFKGTVTMGYPINGTLTTPDFTTTVAAGAEFPDVADALTVDYTDANPHWYTVLPAASQGVYRLTVSVLGEVRTADVPASMMQWKPGYEYTYVFKISESGDVIIDLLEMAVHDWTTSSPLNHNFYNW